MIEKGRAMEQELEYMEPEVREPEVNFTDVGHKKRRRRKRRNRLLAVFGVLGVVLLAVLLVYLGMMLSGGYEDVSGTRVLEASGQAEDAVYSQAQVEALVQEAVAAQALQAADARQAEILGGIRQSLEEGLTVVEMLRKYYPENLVLASGGKYHFVPIRDNLKMNAYDEASLSIQENGEIQYLQEGQVVSYKGIDVSKHQGKIDWKAVAADGVEFAFIRVGNRGYGSGKLVEDERFEQNVKGAQAAGIKVGAYIYSQAITEEEVLEEAEFVLEKIAPYYLECPVVFDVELVSGAKGRMNDLTVEERTRLTALFCETIENAGYRPMIYHNMEMGVLKIDLELLEKYPKWFAYYNPNFYYPYAYDVWQYSEKGKISGIDGEVDLNISFVPLWQE